MIIKRIESGQGTLSVILVVFGEYLQSGASGAGRPPSESIYRGFSKIRSENFQKIQKCQKSILDIFKYVVRTLSLDTLGTRKRL